MKRFSFQAILLAMLFLLSLLVRVVFFEWVPARLTVDEMSIGYNAFSILKTGKDEWGSFLPLMFRAFGDYKLPAYIYLTVPFISLFGLSIFSVKLLSVLCGMLFIWLMYELTKKLIARPIAHIFAVFISAFSPWTIHLSRQALESHLALLFFTIALLLLVSHYQLKKPKYLYWAAFFLGLTFYTYVAYRLLVMLLLPFLICLFVVKKNDWVRNFLAVFILTISLTIPTFFEQAGLARAKQVSLFTDPGIVSAVNDKRAFCFLVDTRLSALCSVFYNKATVGGYRLVNNYASFFSPDFLFLSGDKNIYLNNPDFGEFLWVFAPIFIVGIFGLFRLPLLTRYFVLILLAISPLPAALAGQAQMVRSSAMLVPLILIFAVGADYVYHFFIKTRGRVVLLTLYSAFALFFTGQFLVSYFVIYPTKYDNAAYQLPNQVTMYLASHHPSSMPIYFNHTFSDAHMFAAFYLAIDPSTYQAGIVRPPMDNFGFSHPTQLGTYYFGIQSFEALFCEANQRTFTYISNEPVVVHLPNGATTSYATKIYFNYSGVHPQAYLIEERAFSSYLSQSQISSEIFCGR